MLDSNNSLYPLTPRLIMQPHLYTINATNTQELLTNPSSEYINALEQGQVVYLPQFAFQLFPQEQNFLTDKILKPKQKNISYNFITNDLAGYAVNSAYDINLLHQFMHRYAEFAQQLIIALFPQYAQNIDWGRTSYRPAEIKGRKSSPRQDDTRVHVDAFPSTPVHDKRILRVFCNINPKDPRVWEFGESFKDVMARFYNSIPPYSYFKARLLKLFKATKSLRSPYDHFMLHLHDQMKLHPTYQSTVTKQRFDFPSCSTWVVFTDIVSHAALSGQFLLEQTFYLPVAAMSDQARSPLKQFESRDYVNNCYKVRI